MQKSDCIACCRRLVSWTLPKEMQARTIAIIGRFLCRVCLFSLGFTSVEWTIDEQGQLPEGVEPGAVFISPVRRLVACHLLCMVGQASFEEQN